MSENIEDYQRLDTRTNHLSIPELITTLLTTGTGLQKHDFFGREGNWPSWLEGPSHYFGYADGLRVLDDAYRAGNKPKKVERDLLRERAAFNFQLGGHYVVTRAYELKKPDLLLNTYPLKVLASRASFPAGILAYETEIVLTAKNAGPRKALLKGHHVPYGGPYQVQYCKGVPASEDSWITLPEHFRTCGKIVISGLDPVSMYHFRIRYNGPLGPGPWSRVVSLIIH